MQVEMLPISRIRPYENNPRKNADAVQKVAASLREFGWRQPIVVDTELVVVVGHTRLQAAAELGMREVPVHVAQNLSPAQIRAYRLADNRTNEEAEWDNEKLKIELEGLQLDEFDLDLTGFDPDQIAELLAQQTEGLTDPDAVPETPADPVSRDGDVWILGNHKIICGDSTRRSVVEKLLGGIEPHLMVTDPPYGVNYDPEWRTKAGVGSAGAATGKVLNDDRADWTDAWEHFPGDVAYVWHGGLHATTVARSLLNVDLKPRAQIIWVKTRPALSRGHYHWQHEPCWYAERNAGEPFTAEHEVANYVVRDGHTAHWRGDRKQSTVWFIEHLKSDTGHGTQKPVECMKRPMENNSSAGQAVYEPFSGSGTAIIAGEMTGRHIYAVELNPAYVDVAVERWQAFTGRKAIHAETGEDFETVANQRVPAPSTNGEARNGGNKSGISPELSTRQPGVGDPTGTLEDEGEWDAEDSLDDLAIDSTDYLGHEDDASEVLGRSGSVDPAKLANSSGRAGGRTKRASKPKEPTPKAAKGSKRKVSSKGTRKLAVGADA